MTLRVAVAGCGKTADMHLSGIQRLGKAEVVAACDLEPIMAEQLAARYGIGQCYTDFEHMLAAEEPDVVHIATPPQSHSPLAMAALDAGCHVLIEKPPAMDSYQVSRILLRAESCSRKLTIAYTYYFDPALRMLRDLIAEGVMGEAVHLESFFGYDLHGAFGDPMLADGQHWIHALPGKLLQNVLDHLLIKITEFVTDERPLVFAHAWQGDSREINADYDLPDELRVTVIGEKRSAAAIFSAHARPLQHYLTFHGTKNTAHVDFARSTITLQPDSSLPGVLGRLAAPFAQGWQHFREGGRNVLQFARSDYHFFSGFDYLLASFYESIINDTPVPIPSAEIRRTSELLDEIVHQVCARPLRAA